MTSISEPVTLFNIFLQGFSLSNNFNCAATSYLIIVDDEPVSIRVRTFLLFTLINAKGAVAFETGSHRFLNFGN